MPTSSLASPDLDDWHKYAGDTWESILLGNGSSRAVWDAFKYPSLFDVAKSPGISHPLSVEDQALFKALGDTRNFEGVLGALSTSTTVCAALGLATTQIEERYSSIRDALVAAVHAHWRATGGRTYAYTPIAALPWSAYAEAHGQDVHLKDFPMGHRVRLFRLALSPERTDYVATNEVTNEVTQDSAAAVRDVIGWRWKIEQLHREAKQTTGIARCQARRARSQRNHIACALLVWARLAQVAAATQRSVYAVKYGQLTDYLRHQLRRPSVPMAFA